MVSNTKKKFIYLIADKLIGFKTAFNNYVQDLRSKVKDLFSTNEKLGLAHYYSERYLDALLRFKITGFIWKGYGLYNYNIGRCYLKRGSLEKARRHLEISLQKETEDSKYYLEQALNPSKVFKIPLSVIREYYDYKYNEFDINYAKSNIQLYEFVNNFLTRHPDFSAKVLKILDIGCGLGNLAVNLDSVHFSKTITGIDISSKMIEIASSMRNEKGMKLYQNTENIEVAKFLSSESKCFDLIISLDSFRHAGEDIALYLGLMKRALDFGGMAIVIVPESNNESVQFSAKMDSFYYPQSHLRLALQSVSANIVQLTSVQVEDSSCYVCCVFN